MIDRWTPRRWFHVLLGAVFVPVVSLPLAWGIAVRSLRRASDVESRRWARRIAWLALVDTVVVVAAWAGIAASPASTERETHAAEAEDRVVVGVMPDPAFGGPGARVNEVAPRGPAGLAGVAAGDVIVRVAGTEVAGPDALRTIVRGLRPGVPVSVEVMRGSSTFALDVVPRRASEMPRREVGFLEPVSRGETCLPRVGARPLLLGLLLLAQFPVIGALLARRAPRGAARGAWWAGLSLLAAGCASYVVPAGACTILGGQTAAGSVLALWGSSLTLAAAALVARRSVLEGQVWPATRSWGSATATGAWYLVSGIPRVAVIVFAVTVFLPVPAIGSSPVEAWAAAGLRTTHGPVWLLVAVAGVVFAPIGEELAFRGLLQPALGRWLKPAGAVAVTSLVFASMHWYYGMKLPLVAFTAAVLGWARIASGGLRAPILLHALLNAVSFAFVLLESTGPG